MKRSTTARGFGLIEFKDKYGAECSLQDSSAASEPCVWFGIQKPEAIKFTEYPNLGPYEKFEIPSNIQLSSRMHLTQTQVRELLPFLQQFAETGEYITQMPEYDTLKEK